MSDRCEERACERPDGAFVAATEPLRGALRVHCYRMLGSSHDGEDVVQETLLRAWRARDSLTAPEMMRPWLYRIATNVCLDELKKRPRRALSSDTHPAADPRAPITPRIDEPIWLEPMPDAWLGSVTDADPAARYTLRESVALAFVAAIQMLSPAQRATLLLRDVVGLSAEETAAALEMSVASVNSALHRARTAVEEKLGGKSAAAYAETSPAREVDEAVIAQYVRAFETANVDALVALFHEELVTRMPPSPMWIGGREANDVFYRRMFPNPGEERFRYVPIAANGQLAYAFYRRPPATTGPFVLHGIQLIAVRDRAIASVDLFAMEAVFPLFDVARELPIDIGYDGSR